MALRPSTRFSPRRRRRFSSAWAWRTEQSPAPSPVAVTPSWPSTTTRPTSCVLMRMHSASLGSSDELTDLVAAAAFVVDPGLPEQHEAFAIADAAGVAVVSEFDLAAVWDDRPIVAVTGTNGKTTTVELAVAALAADGRVAVAAGNTDIPLVTAIDDPNTTSSLSRRRRFDLHAQPVPPDRRHLAELRARSSRRAPQPRKL